MTRKPTHAIPAAGHNSGALDRDQLANLVSRIEELEGQKKDLLEDLKGLYTEAAANGYDKSALKEVIRVRLMEEEKRHAWEMRRETVDSYRASLGDLADLPLGRAALARDGLVPPV
jgi:uncharacterized protein (UPF0335 family)